MRIPLLIRFPGSLQAGLEVNETVLNLDMFPSVLGLLKLKPPAEVRHNGKDFKPLLFGTSDPNWRTEIFGQYDLQLRPGLHAHAPHERLEAGTLLSH